MAELKGAKSLGTPVSSFDSNQALATMLKAKSTDVSRAADLEIRDNADVPNTPVEKVAVTFGGLALPITNVTEDAVS
ncbi:MAG: hypothetical protein QNJ44_14975 [Rhodobacter sp.]|nr:hypothetical protein [Rhodobacter sp.]